MRRLKAFLKKYFSGKLAIVQVIAGGGAFAGRSLAAYLTQDHGTWNIVLASQVGSFAGYIGIYALGYRFVFRRDYRNSSRSMKSDVLKLQVVEQTPNIGTVISSSLAQAALISGGGVSPIISANLASWFGPHKIANLAAMATSNSLKKAWVDDTWRPLPRLRALANGVGRAGRGLVILFKKRLSRDKHESVIIDPVEHEVIR
ncbi:hypothetical protein ACFLTS_05455 [Chloroflexota bacterium]